MKWKLNYNSDDITNAIIRYATTSYLIPQTSSSSTIVTPDGKEVTVTLQNPNAKALVPTEEFIEAVADAVQRIRSLENTEYRWDCE